MNNNSLGRQMYFFTLLKKCFIRVVDLYKRRNPIQYAMNKGVIVGENCKFVDNPDWGTEPYLIKIGCHVLIAGGVVFITHDGSTWVFRETEQYKDIYKFGPISIGDNCFIGFRSIILPNVSVGNNCIIAAGSVVTKNVPDGEIWGGVPARFICKTMDYAEKCHKNRLPYDMALMKKDKRKEIIRVVYGENYKEKSDN